MFLLSEETKSTCIDHKKTFQDIACDPDGLLKNQGFSPLFQIEP